MFERNFTRDGFRVRAQKTSRLSRLWTANKVAKIDLSRQKSFPSKMKLPRALLGPLGKLFTWRLSASARNVHGSTLNSTLDGKQSFNNVRSVKADDNRCTLLATGKEQTQASPYDTKVTWCALYGFLLVSLALSAYVIGVALGPVRWMFLDPPLFRRLNEDLIWYSGIPLVAGIMLICRDLFPER